MPKPEKPPAPKPKPKAPSKLTNYAVFMVAGSGPDAVLRPISSGIQADFPREPRIFQAKTPQEARDKAFAKLTREQPADKQDEFTVPLVALAATGWSFEEMAWKIERKVARP